MTHMAHAEALYLLSTMQCIWDAMHSFPNALQSDLMPLECLSTGRLLSKKLWNSMERYTWSSSFMS